MSVLLFRLSAPLQTWPDREGLRTVSTRMEPTRSGLTGLLSACLGIRRGMPSPFGDARFGVLVEREGLVDSDYHVTRRMNGSGLVPIPVGRDYLADARFLIGVESADRSLLESCEYGLSHPVFIPYLGRRACVPDVPLHGWIVDGPLDTALTQHMEPEPGCSGRLVMDAETTSAGFVDWREDMPVTTGRTDRAWRARPVTTRIIDRAGEEPVEDPFVLAQTAATARRGIA